jgi:uncharacterized protein involved in high-affinity Fe2+ transport
MRYSTASYAATAALLAALATSASAAEYPIGKPSTQAGLEVSAVYLQPIEMDPPGMMRAAADSDVHLEADIHATAGNKNGFPDGEWVPALVVKYEVAKIGSDQHVEGEMMEMVADDGPHYGDNVKLFGPGKYLLTLTVSPPGPAQHFGRHVDKETGVGPWFQTFKVSSDFVFAGTGKKGGY